MDNERIVIGRETDHVGRLHASQEGILGRTIYLHNRCGVSCQTSIDNSVRRTGYRIIPPVQCRGVVGPSPVDDFHAAANGQTLARGSVVLGPDYLRM
jgi:hypothetical protein